MIRLLFVPIYLFATQFYISFQYTIKNNKVINEQLNISKCMQELKLPIIKQFKYRYEHNKLKDIFKFEKEHLIDLFSKEGVILHNNQKVINFYPDDKIKITYLPKRFDVFFFDGYLIFRLLKE